MADNDFTLLTSTKDFSAFLIKSIKEAKKSIKLQFFAFEADNAGLPVFELLKNRAKEGIEVKVLIDDFINWKNNDTWFFFRRLPNKRKANYLEWFNTRQMVSEMRKYGIQVEITNKTSLLNLYSLFVKRSHKKLAVIDEEIAMTGGINLTEHNFDRNDTFTVIKKNNVVSVLNAIFDQKFEYGTSQYEPILLEGGEEIYQFTQPLMKRVRELVANAKERIYFEAPYFVDNRLFSMLREKKAQGLEVKLLFTSILDQPYVHGYQKRYKRLEPKMVVFRKKPNLETHAKLALIDEYSLFGSDNFMSQKLMYQHEEVMIITKDANYNNQLLRYFRNSVKENS